MYNIEYVNFSTYFLSKSCKKITFLHSLGLTFDFPSMSPVFSQMLEVMFLTTLTEEEPTSTINKINIRN